MFHVEHFLACVLHKYLSYPSMSKNLLYYLILIGQRYNKYIIYANYYV